MLQIKTQNILLTPAIKNYISDHIQKVNKKNPKIIYKKFTVKKEHSGYYVKILADLEQKNISADYKGHDLYVVIKETLLTLNKRLKRQQRTKKTPRIIH